MALALSSSEALPSIFPLKETIVSRARDSTELSKSGLFMKESSLAEAMWRTISPLSFSPLYSSSMFWAKLCTSALQERSVSILFADWLARFTGLRYFLTSCFRASLMTGLSFI